MSPFRSPFPVVVAAALALKFDIPVFPTHGIIRTKSGEFECNCMPWARKRAHRDGLIATPCPAPGKMPAVKWTAAATTDPHTLRAFLKARSSNNFAATTGERAGIIIIDIDGMLGFASLAELEAQFGPLPLTWRTISGSGKGCHFWFRYPPGFDVRSTVSQVAKAIDIRANGGLIVLPGSTHISGGCYRWAEGCAPDETDLAELPEAWLNAAIQACKKTRTANDPAKPRQPAEKRGPRTAREKAQHADSLIIGDGEGRGGFHGPINRICVKYFGQYGADAAAGPLKVALRDAILNAPADNHEPYQIERYASDAYLDEAIESARDYIRRNTMKT